MQKYSEFAPTGWDPKGVFLHGEQDGEDCDRQDWLVVPVSQTRDSGCLERSNFDVAIGMLTEAVGEWDSTTWECHRFGHWGPGWFEILIVNPDNAVAVRVAEEIERSLADYPILDEEHLSDLEMSMAAETWGYLSIKERFEIIEEWNRHCHGEEKLSLFAARRPDLPSPLTLEELNPDAR